MRGSPFPFRRCANSARCAVLVLVQHPPSHRWMLLSAVCHTRGHFLRQYLRSKCTKICVYLLSIDTENVTSYIFGGGLFTPSKSGSDGEKDERTSEKDQRIKGKHQRKVSLSLGLNTALHVIQHELLET